MVMFGNMEGEHSSLWLLPRLATKCAGTQKMGSVPFLQLMGIVEKCICLCHISNKREVFFCLQTFAFSMKDFGLLPPFIAPNRFTSCPNIEYQDEQMPQ